MPNLNEITKFREELKDIAQEDTVTARWGERVYDELPPPDPAEVPDIDLDALLPSIESDKSESDESDKSAGEDRTFSEPGESRASAQDEAPSAVSGSDMFDTVPVTDEVPDISFPDGIDNADVSEAAVGSAGDAESVDNDAYPVNDDGSEDAFPVGDDEISAMPELDDFLSSFHFDDPLAGDNAPSEAVMESADADASDSDAEMSTDTSASLIPADDIFEMPSAEVPVTDEHDVGAASLDKASSSGNEETPDFDDLLSSLDFDSQPEKGSDGSGSEEPVASGDTSFADGYDMDSIPADDAVPPEADADFSMDMPDIDLSAFDSLSDAAPVDGDASSGAEVSGNSVPPEEQEPFDEPAELLEEEPEIEAAPVSDTELNESDTASSSGGAPAFGEFGDLAEFSLFSENRDESGTDADGTSADDRSGASPDSGTEEESSEESDDVSDPDDVGMPGHITDDFFTQQPESDLVDQSGFALEENPLDSEIAEVTDDQFNLPDNFKDFSTDTHSRMFDSVIAKSTGAPGEGDALSLSDEEYFQFLTQIESFPFNVQLAIQDYIANADDRPENKMDFIRFILAKNSLKKIAHKLEKILKKSIPIPRGFQRKSVEEYEREKRTFKYRFMHKILPVAVMSAIALILIFCISVLSWQFIYKPITSESLYKSGYAYLENGQYETAIEKFNKAGEYKRKKRWYFSYARAFRKKKQFTAAEKMYIRLIYDFNYDKQGGLEYADMLSTDLRNYEKAETVLRRRVLDQHVNDKDGLLALGDVYMNWADEDPEKYDTAVKIYSRLIELYGENDTFLLRMMRYFIRTDNLAEVLNLKEHFASRITKIGAQNLTELGGYLLEKRYNPKPLDSERLRMQIDDVRLLLEKAVQADKSVPESYYHLGRFFIYNYKQDGAIENLTEAIKRFETESSMSARRTMYYVDAIRLLGEQLVTQKKYLDAQRLYADALNIYREYTAFKPLPPNQNIGKLYADYGDIDYFISHNFESALDSYQHAVKELYNTPSVNYRIGYIQYQQEDYQHAIEAMSLAYAEKAKDKNLLYGFGNAFFKRGDYFAAVAAYEQLLTLLNGKRARKEHVLTNTRPDDVAFIERYMHTANNLGATLNRLAERTGDSQTNGRALALYAEATRAWDALTRNPQTMIRAKSVGLAYLNTQNMLNAKSTYESEIYTDIPMILENERALEQKEDK